MMSKEIELKLSLPVSAQRQLLRQPILAKAVSKHTQQLVNLYYDTPKFDLHHRSIALRLRKQGKIWLQTVKCAGSSAAGLTSRPEWETPYSGHFDFSLVDADQVREWLNKPRISKNIAPIFETNFRRTTWRFEPQPGCFVLLMFDRGWIVADGKRLPISELEIELAAGQEDVTELFHLAETLAERIALVPAILSKAERGYHLFQSQPLKPLKSAVVALHQKDTPLQTFRQIALSSLEHLQGNYEGAINCTDAEFIHQMRISIRRLHAAVRLFAPHLPTMLASELYEPLRLLSTQLGHARDLYILLAEIASPVSAAFPDEPRLAALSGAITDRHYAAHTTAVRTLQSIGYGHMLLHVIALLQKPPFTIATNTLENAEPASSAQALSVFAKQRLKKFRSKALMLAQAATTSNPASLHQLRIGIKRLRYALEFFTPLVRENPSRQQLRRLLQHLAELQGSLGQLNDLANACQLLMHCAGEDPRLREAVALVGGWHGARYGTLLANLPAQIKRLHKLKLPKIH